MNRIQTSLFTLALLALPAMAHADLTVVAEVSGAGQGGGFVRFGGPGGGGAPAAQPAPAKQTVTTYYKGRKARTEVKGGPVTIYDADAGKVYRLDPARKTYTVAALRDVLDGKDGGPFGAGGPGGVFRFGGPGGPGAVSGTVGTGRQVEVRPLEGGELQERRQRFGGGQGGNLDPAEQARREQMRDQILQQVAQTMRNITYATTLTMTESAERKTLAEQDALRVDLKGELKMILPAGAFGGGRFGGGGRQNGGGPPQPPATQLEGEVWVVRGRAFSLLPDNGRLGLFPTTALLNNGPGSAAVAKSLSDRLVKASALPVALTMRSKRQMPNFRGRGPGAPGGPEAAGRGQGGGVEMRENVQTSEMQVTALSAAELPDSLFGVPSDYTDATPDPAASSRPVPRR